MGTSLNIKGIVYKKDTKVTRVGRRSTLVILHHGLRESWFVISSILILSHHLKMQYHYELKKEKKVSFLIAILKMNRIHKNSDSRRNRKTTKERRHYPCGLHWYLP